MKRPRLLDRASLLRYHEAMKYCLEDTIVAIASAPGSAARGVIRLSGPSTVNVLGECFSSRDECRLENIRQPAVLEGQLQLTASQNVLPCALHLWPSARSYTRQPAAELHTMGSPPLLSLAMKSLCHAGARLAEPGEFTLRAFLAGRVDLTQAEAVLGVIDAQDQRELTVSLAQMAGGIAQPLHNLRGRLIDLLADLEAGLDFVEEDIQFISAQQVESVLVEASATIELVVRQMCVRSTRSDAPRVVLIGAPNAGKSSLFNALVESKSAIVSPQPGTTRDYLVARLSLDGIACELIDTAGVESAQPDLIDAASQRQSLRQRESADIRLLCIDIADSNSAESNRAVCLNSENDLVVYTKCDTAQIKLPFNGHVTSSLTGDGLPQLKAAIAGCLRRVGSSETSVVHATAERCEESLRAALRAIEAARELNAKKSGEELVAAEIRLALDELGRVVGAVYTDDLLDRIFSRFCIGK